MTSAAASLRKHGIDPPPWADDVFEIGRIIINNAEPLFDWSGNLIGFTEGSPPTTERWMATFRVVEGYGVFAVRAELVDGEWQEGWRMDLVDWLAWMGTERKLEQ